MGQRSRKRRAAGAVPEDAAAATSGAATPSRPAAAPEAADPNAAMRRGYARGEVRNEAIRRELVPYGPGERPLALIVAVVVATVVGLANPVLYAVGYEVRGEEPELLGVALFAAIMLAAAVGMWAKRYWAILGFQALLAVSLLAGSAALVVASNWRGAVLAALFVLGAGVLFWKLIRVMARVQVPERPGRRP